MMINGYDVSYVKARYGKLIVPTYDSVVGHSLRLYGEWAEHEIQSISNHIESAGCIIDIGANIGTTALAYGSRFPRSKIYAFEPNSFLFSLLSFNSISNHFDNISVLPIGCGSEAETFLNFPKMESGLVNFGASNAAKSLASVPTRSALANSLTIHRLDEILFEEIVSFIKIDTEGMEGDVLDGAIRILRSSRPLLFIEASDYEKTNGIIDMLLSLDYKLYWHETSAYNANNFNMYYQNVWTNLEIGILAFPVERYDRPPLPQIIGPIDAIPRFHPIDYAFHGDRFVRPDPWQ